MDLAARGQTWGQAGQVVPADVEVPQRLQLADLRRQHLDLIAAHVLREREGERERERGRGREIER